MRTNLSDSSGPLSRGDGRFLARLPTTRWMSTRYSSLSCFSQKASVSAVMAANFSAIARGILSAGDMAAVRMKEGRFTRIGQLPFDWGAAPMLGFANLALDVFTKYAVHTRLPAVTRGLEVRQNFRAVAD